MTTRIYITGPVDPVEVAELAARSVHDPSDGSCGSWVTEDKGPGADVTTMVCRRGRVTVTASFDPDDPLTVVVVSLDGSSTGRRNAKPVEHVIGMAVLNILNIVRDMPVGTSLRWE